MTPIAMDTPSNKRLEDVFAGAAELPTRDCAAFLDAEAGQPELRAEVEEFLRSHEASGTMANSANSRRVDIHERLAWLKPEEAGDRIGNYKLLEQIWEGGFGVVWVAEQERPVRGLMTRGVRSSARTVRAS